MYVPYPDAQKVYDRLLTGEDTAKEALTITHLEKTITGALRKELGLFAQLQHTVLFSNRTSVVKKLQ